MFKLIAITVLSFTAAVATALPAQLDCHNETRETKFGDIQIRHVVSGGVMFTKMTVTHDRKTETVWVDGPSGLGEGLVRTYYGKDLIFTVTPDAQATLKLIDVHEDGTFDASYDTYVCEAAADQRVPQQ